jgi:VIT1/CCC1 family predicted Fe2+/Mn2+ transporter
MDKQKKQESVNVCRPYQTKFSFGATSGIITNMALITGLGGWQNAKTTIIAGMLVVALADNVSDSMGIHIYQESECLGTKEVWFGTFTNFSSRLLVSSTFILLVYFLPLPLAAIFSVVWGLLLLATLSYLISKDKKINPYQAMFEHVGIAILVVIASHFLGKLINGKV